MSFMFKRWFEDEPADITKGELASLKSELESKEIKEDRIVAIKALEQNPCENAISRQAALDLCERFDGCVPYSVLSNYDMLPSVNPQPKTGHWIYGKWERYELKHGSFVDTGWKCSVCKAIEKKMYHFCPNCGAEMPRGDADGKDKTDS